MSADDAFRLFGLNNLMIEQEVRRIEQEHDVDFGHRSNAIKNKDNEDYYPQFPAKLREEARQMAIHYQIFYCLENDIRELITGRLQENGPDWWEKCVPQSVRDTAKKNIDREVQQGVTPRSEAAIDYINFGELGQIISANWPIFGDMLKNKLAVERILSQLNLLRGPIAHCKPLAEDEVDRLELGLRDWFRQLS